MSRKSKLAIIIALAVLVSIPSVVFAHGQVNPSRNLDYGDNGYTGVGMLGGSANMTGIQASSVDEVPATASRTTILQRPWLLLGLLLVAAVVCVNLTGVVLGIRWHIQYAGSKHTFGVS